MSAWKRAVHIRDSSRCCYWMSPTDGPELFCGTPGVYVQVGSVLVVDASNGEWEVLDEADFCARWVDEADCCRNPKAVQSLLAIPKAYMDRLREFEGEHAEASA